MIVQKKPTRKSFKGRINWQAYLASVEDISLKGASTKNLSCLADFGC